MVHLGEARQQQGFWQTSELGHEQSFRVRVKLVVAAHPFGLSSIAVEKEREWRQFVVQLAPRNKTRHRGKATQCTVSEGYSRCSP